MTASTNTLLHPPLWQGWAIALTGTTIFSIGPTATKIAFNFGFDSVSFLMLRYVIGATFLVLTIGVLNPQHFRIDRRGLLLCIVAGSLLVTALQLFTFSLTRINASIASMMVALYPVTVLVLLAFRGEKFTYRNGARLGLSLTGVYLLIGPGGQVDVLGAALVIGASIVFACYMVMIQWYLGAYESRTVALYVVVVILLANIGLWAGQGAVWPQATWQGWLAVIAVGLGSSYLGQILLYSAIQHIGSGQMALLNPVETFLSVTWALLFLQERLSLLQWIGGALIIVSMLLAIQRLNRVQLLKWWARLRPNL